MKILPQKNVLMLMLMMSQRRNASTDSTDGAETKQFIIYRKLILLPYATPSFQISLPHPPHPPLHAAGDGLQVGAMAKIRVSYEYSEAEDKSIRLGLFLIACGILSLFILGFCWLNPTLQSLQSKPANCTVSPATSSKLRAVSCGCCRGATARNRGALSLSVRKYLLLPFYTIFIGKLLSRGFPITTASTVLQVLYCTVSK